MYSYIKGNVINLSPTQAVLDNQGIGYEIEISLRTYEKIRGQSVTLLYIRQIVREDSHTLFGFCTEKSRQIFDRLVSVSGIGPNTARLILSAMSPSEIANCVLSEDDRSFARVKGIGPKTAKRIILDLKDKVADLAVDGAKSNDPSSAGNTIQDEALSALIALGFRKQQVAGVLNQLSQTGQSVMPVEDVIKVALQKLSGKS